MVRVLLMQLPRRSASVLISALGMVALAGTLSPGEIPYGVYTRLLIIANALPMPVVEPV